MDLILVGAGTFGREVFTWLSQAIGGSSQYKIKGYIDNLPQNQIELDLRNFPIPILGTINDYQPKPDEKLVMSIFDPTLKKQFVKLLLKRGSKFYKLIHPSVIIGHNVKVGDGCIICPNCILANDTNIGDYVFINTSSTIGHDTVVGSFTSINGGVQITGDVKVGSECFFGVGSLVINKRNVGDRAIVGAGSVVIRSVRPDVTVFGNPAKIVKGSNLPNI
jgi:sugar O-acyltransferase (sialic acid O-acetyltransferase NeuD family)